MPKPLREFVLLEHELPASRHWDLLLDTGETVVTWQLLEDPRVGKNRGKAAAVRARRLPDHRRAYLDYEGPVSRNRGRVTRIDHGSYAVLEQRPDGWTVQLAGSSVSGRFRLVAGDRPSDG